MVKVEVKMVDREVQHLNFCGCQHFFSRRSSLAKIQRADESNHRNKNGYKKILVSFTVLVSQKPFHIQQRVRFGVDKIIEFF